MSRELSPRRRIWETAQQVTIGRKVTQEEIVANEQRFQQVWDGSGEKDFSFYSDPDYVYLLLNSWSVRSGQDTDFLIRQGLFVEPKAVFDFHGGMGLTAMRLAMQYPQATVYSHALAPQHREWCQAIARELQLPNVVATDQVTPADLLIAQETMEHIKNPMAEMEGLLEKVKPRQYLDGSSFSIVSPGHFSVFQDLEGDPIPLKSMKRLFYKFLRSRGFSEYWERRPGQKKPFNGRPALFDGPGEPRP